MTIKKLGISLAAASFLATAAMASGTATVDSNSSTIASELVVGQDYNGTSVDLNTTYRPSLTAGVQDGKVLVEFDGGRLQSVPNTILVYNQTQGKIVGYNPTLSGLNNQKLIFDVNDSINDADTLYLADSASDDGNASTHEVNASVVLDVLNGSSKVGMKYTLLDNVDGVRDSADAGTVIATKQEWSIGVKTKFDAYIDAAASFKKFIDDGTGNTTVDKSQIAITHTAVDVGTGALDLNVKTYMDNNVSTAATSFDRAATGGSLLANVVLASDTTGYVWDENVTTAAAVSDDYNLTFTADTTNTLSETVFTTSVEANSAASNPSFTKTYLTKADLGNWSIYGYKAQIPNVSAIAGGNDTTLKFTNRSSNEQSVYFTLIDPDGTSVVVDSSDSSVSTIPSNATGKYKASALAALAVAKDVNFDASTTVSIEVSIPTTPSKVYGMASMRNTAGNFKELPVYNSSTMAY